MNPLKNKYINVYSRFLIILLLTTIGACSTTNAVQHHKEEQIEAKLTRGVSTKADVLKIIGKRNGFGTSLIPGDPIIRELWSYEDINISQISGNIDQKTLLIYFKDNIYDGYMSFAYKVKMNTYWVF